MPVQDYQLEIIAAKDQTQESMQSNGYRLIATFFDWEEYNQGDWVFDTEETTCHVTEDDDGLHFWVAE